MEKMISALKQGEERYIAQAITMVENKEKEGKELLKELYTTTKIAYLVGITGPPGSGKSTLCEKIVRRWRKQEVKVGIIAVDPTSHYTGGALLGDRIRLGDLSSDRGVFIRSMATRGRLGGLSAAVFATVIILSAAGYEYILIETVGVGQNEIDIVNLADTTLVVTTPEAGDEIQTFKAGLMEVGDIFIINKADRPDADKMELIVNQLIEMNNKWKDEWRPEVIKTVAIADQGIRELLEMITSHFNYLAKNGLMQERRKEVIRSFMSNLLEEKLKEELLQPITKTTFFKEGIEKIYQFKNDPFSLVEDIWIRLWRGGAGLGNED